MLLGLLSSGDDGLETVTYFDWKRVSKQEKSKNKDIYFTEYLCIIKSKFDILNLLYKKVYV